MYYFDGHCDTLTRCCIKSETLLENTGHVKITDTVKTGPDYVFAICLNHENFEAPFENACRYIGFFQKQADLFAHMIQPIKTIKDLKNQAGKTGVMLALEGAHPLEGKLENIAFFYSLGIRLITLTWNDKNAVGFGHRENKGLLAFGFEAVEEMNRLGIAVDVSHLSDKGFWDVLSVSKKPVLASHSNSRALCPASRNLSDGMLKALADTGGLCGVNFYPPFLHRDKEATWAHVLAHIGRLVHTMGGEHVGIGSDFDGIDETPKGLEDHTCMPFLYEKTAKKYGASLADKIFWQNYHRVLKDILH